MGNGNGRRRDGRRERSWRSRLARCGASGLTVREFCRREGVPETAFYYWRREVEERDRAAAGLRRMSSGSHKRTRQTCRAARGNRSGVSSVCGATRGEQRAQLLFLPVELKARDGDAARQLKVCDGDASLGGVVELRLASGHTIVGAEVEKMARLAALLVGLSPDSEEGGAVRSGFRRGRVSAC